MIVPSERAARTPTPISLSKLLLVEGETPLHFFEAFAKHLGLDKEIEIRSFGGIKQLPSFLRAIVSTGEFKKYVKSLGIARDCESDPVAAKSSVVNAVSAANLTPSTVVNFTLLPDESSSGMIETLMLRSVQEQPVLRCIDNFVTCAIERGATIPASPGRDKHLVQIYLATCNEVQLSPGIAASRGIWPFDHPAFEDIVCFLKRL